MARFTLALLATCAMMMGPWAPTTDSFSLHVQRTPCPTRGGAWARAARPQRRRRRCGASTTTRIGMSAIDAIEKSFVEAASGMGYV